MSLLRAAGLLLVFQASPAMAWDNESGPCGGEAYWDPGSEVVHEMCLSANGFPGLPAATDSVSNYSAAFQSMIDGYWMWVKDDTSDFELQVDQEFCYEGAENGEWWDDEEELSDAWYETVALTTTKCNLGFTVVACEGTDHFTCIWPDVDSEIIASDIMMTNNNAWTVVDQNGMAECFVLDNADNMENTWVHEVGHSYGLDHINSTLSVENTTGFGHHNCHVAQGFNTYPMPDDIGGLMDDHKGYSGSVFNYAGTPWQRTGGASVIQNSSQLLSGSGSFLNLTLSSTVHSFYPHTSSFVVRIVMIPTSSPPTFNWGSGTWSYTSVNSWSDTVSSVGRTSLNWNKSVIVLATYMTVGVTYRFWVHVDPAGSVAETDEGDNLFPLNVTVRRTS